MDEMPETACPKRLLIVDDEPGITGLIEIAAKQLGYSVSSIHDSDRFEKAFQSTKPTAVFLDINMPNRGALELIAYLARANYTGKVVVMSGSDPHYVQKSSATGAARGLTIAGMLTKPFRKQQLLDLLVSLSAPVSNDPC